MIHSIISEYDIFYTDSQPEMTEKDVDGGKMLLMKTDGKYKPYRFFSTDPKKYLEKDNQITRFYF